MNTVTTIVKEVHEVNFDSVFDLYSLDYIECKLVEISPSGEIRYQVEIRPDHWVPRKMKAPKRVYRAFKGRYTVTKFIHRAKSAVIALYQGEVIDIEIVFDLEDFEDGEAGEAGETSEVMRFLTTSNIKANVDRLHESINFGQSDLHFDGQYVIDSKSYSSDEVIPNLIKISKVCSLNLHDLKNSLFSIDENKFVRLPLLRDRLEVNIGTFENPVWAATPTISSKGGSGKRKSRSLSISSQSSNFWRKVLSNKEFINKSYVNLEFSLKLNSMLGRQYGRAAANEIDLFKICGEVGVFPFQLDDALKQLLPYKFEKDGEVIEGVTGIIYMAKLIAERSSKETDAAKLADWSKLLSHLSSYGISHVNRVKKMYEKGAEAKLKEGTFHKISDISSPGYIDVDALTFTD